MIEALTHSISSTCTHRQGNRTTDTTTDLASVSGIVETCKSSSNLAIVIVDPFSTGARMAWEAKSRNMKVVRVLSTFFEDAFLETILPARCRDLTFDATIIFEAGQAAKAVDEICRLPFKVTAVLNGCESGLYAFDSITELMPGIPTNGSATSPLRRNKKHMGDRVRDSGLRAAKQLECGTWEEVYDFISALGVREAEDGEWCVLKPVQSAGTDGVHISKCVAQARACFAKVVGSRDVFGEVNTAVLVQEFLRGKEYVVDSVSVDGEHKCVAIWEYDKRPCNNSQFVYFGMQTFQTRDGCREDAMVTYMHSVLDALGCKNGPSHGELIWLEAEDKPCLVEVGSRPHGGDGSFMDASGPVIGYSQISVMLDILEEPRRFQRLPTRPAKFSGCGMELDLVSRETGVLRAYPKLDDVRALRSYVSMEIKVTPGRRLQKTVDFVTTPGIIMLVHDDRRVVEEDRKTIERWQEEGSFYDCEVLDENTDSLKCIDSSVVSHSAANFNGQKF